MKKKACFYIFVLLVQILYFKNTAAQVVLSEIMFDALGSDAHDEFVEIVNLSSRESVDLSGWQISDGSGNDFIVGYNQGLILNPGQFAVILDASYFGNSTTYDSLIPPEALILTIDNKTFGSRGFSNSSAETVFLINAENEVVSQYTYSLGNQPGFSDEKIDLAGPNSPDNWADSKSLFGTPGAPNSVAPVEQDLAVFQHGIRFLPENIRKGESVTIFVNILNQGTKPSMNFQALIFDDTNNDFIGQPNEQILPAISITEPILPGDSLQVQWDWTEVPAGVHPILINLDYAFDQDTTNNLAFRELKAGYFTSDVVVNEIMYAPLTGTSEWVEIFNKTSEIINLKDWSISDRNERNPIVVEKNFVIPPASYAVFAADSSFLKIFSPPAESFMIFDDFPSLNNDFDSVILYDFTGNRIDRVDYSKNWGGGNGISLERINPEFASNDSSNWSSSVAPEGGTPGRQNSIFTRLVPTSTVLSVQPNPFSPDGDGRDDFVVISFNLPVTTASVNLKIYDVHGRLINFLLNNQPTGSNYSVIWDGNDFRKQKARIGIYIVYLEALNAQNGVVFSAKKTLVLAGNL